MEKRYYRPTIRLDYDNPDDMEIIRKIENRNKALYKSVNDYLIHAVYAFSPETGKGEKELVSTENEKLERPGQTEGKEEAPLDPGIAAFLSDNF